MAEQQINESPVWKKWKKESWSQGMASIQAHTESLQAILQKAYERLSIALTQEKLTSYQKGIAFGKFKYLEQALTKTYPELTRWVHSFVPESFNMGVEWADMNLQELGEGKPIPMTQVMVRQLKLISEEVFTDIAGRTMQMKESAVKFLREEFAKAIREGTALGQPQQKIIQELYKKLKSQDGFEFVDRNGKRWDLKTYTKMAVNTYHARINREAKTQRFLERGFDVGQITFTGAKDECQFWEGKRVALTEDAAKQFGLPMFNALPSNEIFHPNCHHSIGMTKEIIQDRNKAVRDMAANKPPKMPKSGGSTVTDRPDEVIKERLKTQAEEKIEKDLQYKNSMQERLNDPTVFVSFSKLQEHSSISLNGIPFGHEEPQDFRNILDKIDEPKFVPHPEKKTSTGVIIEEPDGRIWIFEPKDHYGGIEHTFPKGQLEPNLTMQQNAMKEAYEESGLNVKITGFVGDYERGTTKTRYYKAVRTGGDPADAHWEAARVKLVPKERLKDFLNMEIDHKLLNDYIERYHLADSLEFVPGSQGGSNPGGKFINKYTGKVYYGKFYANTMQAKSEILAQNIASAFGLEAPKSRIISVMPPPGLIHNAGTGRRMLLLTDYEEGLTSIDLRGKKTWNQNNELAKHHIVAGLVENWDVVGLSMDNLLQNKDGKFIVIDSGGSFRFRAQGGPKAYGPDPSAFDTLLNLSMNHQSASVFGPVFNEFTKKNAKQYVNQLTKLTDTKLKALCKEAGFGTDTELINNLIARKHKLIAMLGSYVVMKQATPSDVMQKIESSDIKGIVAEVKKARIVGKNVRSDLDLVEDTNTLWWEEKTMDNKVVTKIKLKLTKKGAERVSDFVEAQRNKPYDPKTLLEEDVFWPTISAAMETLSKGRDSASMAKINAALELTSDLTRLSRNPDLPKEVSAMATYYLSILRELEDGAMMGIYSAYLRKESMEAPNGVKTIQVKTEVKEVKAKEIIKGYAKETETNAFRLNKNKKVVVLTKGAVEATYYGKYHGKDFSIDTEGRGEHKFYAFEGQVELKYNGEFNDNAYKEIVGFMGEMGIDMSQTPKEFKEWLYLMQGLHKLGDKHPVITEINNSDWSYQKKVAELKGYVALTHMIDLPSNEPYPEWYNPEGEVNHFGDGWNKRYRWDFTKKDAEERFKDQSLSHYTETKLDQLVGYFLDQGGDFTCTMERLRKGIPLSGGESPETDMHTGGANYVFFTMQNQYKVDNGRSQIRLKKSVLSRMDLVAYSGDNYGRMYEGASHYEQDFKPEKWEKYKQNSRRNEFMVKNALSIFDEVEAFVCLSQYEAEELLKVFKNHGITEMPDGRPVKSMIFYGNNKPL
ncbi:MAG: NUDIX domain-containing protein [SAR324 cluster bacterium]|nr:NUDIX domain-containing protein [SAR324 cluster bacterium]